LNEPTSVATLVEDFVARGVLGAAALPSGKAGRERYRIIWFRSRIMQLDVDLRHGRARLSDVLPPIAPRSKLDRALRTWLRSRESPDLPAHRRLDPAEFRSGLRNAAGVMQLSVVSAVQAPELAVRKLLGLTSELYLDFLAAPERYDWILEAFDLDPDSPRWP
jgi:hypothetical protein